VPRYKLIIEYVGTPYAGWQAQDGQTTVQGALEGALQKFCGKHIKVTGSGRTDAGVHAIGQVAHIDLDTTESTFTINEAMNFHLKRERISVMRVEQVDEDFHARFHATKRYYRYTILNRRPPPCHEDGFVWHIRAPLDVQRMQEASKSLIGLHDFSAFRAKDCQAESAEKTLDAAEVRHDGDHIFIDVAARSFLYNQVRIITGTLAEIGKKDGAPISMIEEALHGKRRELAGPTAPAHGLCFMKVDF
jgi:tRNA pseudouridine38-40 synthase